MKTTLTLDQAIQSIMLDLHYKLVFQLVFDPNLVNYFRLALLLIKILQPVCNSMKVLKLSVNFGSSPFPSSLSMYLFMALLLADQVYDFLLEYIAHILT